ncbi:hypothetical protein NHJ6243_008949 [Beauveria neobassiana]
MRGSFDGHIFLAQWYIAVPPFLLGAIDMQRVKMAVKILFEAEELATPGRLALEAPLMFCRIVSPARLHFWALAALM